MFTPFSCWKLPCGTTRLELVKSGRSVDLAARLGARVRSRRRNDADGKGHEAEKRCQTQQLHWPHLWSLSCKRCTPTATPLHSIKSPVTVRGLVIITCHTRRAEASNDVCQPAFANPRRPLRPWPRTSFVFVCGILLLPGVAFGKSTNMHEPSLCFSYRRPDFRIAFPKRKFRGCRRGRITTLALIGAAVPRISIIERTSVQVAFWRPSRTCRADYLKRPPLVLRPRRLGFAGLRRQPSRSFKIGMESTGACDRCARCTQAATKSV
jgi:hypothetical protein